MRAISLVTVVALASFQAQAVGFSVRGVGGNSCAAWVATPNSETSGRTWITGYFTGRNAEGAALGQERLVGRTTDFEGIVGEIRLACSKSPSRTLEDVTTEFYDKLLRANR